MNDNILRSLANLGLKANERAVYLSCLGRSEGMQIYEIVQDTGLKRTTVDVVVERLIDRGYLTRSRTGKRFKYQARHPRTVLASHEQVLEDFRQTIPWLEAMGAHDKDVDFQFYDTLEQLYRVYDEEYLRLRMQPSDQREILGISSARDVASAIPDYDKYIRKRIDLGIPVKILRPYRDAGDRMGDSDPAAYREIRYFDGHRYPFHISMDIYENCVNIYMIEPHVSGFVMKSKAIADSMRALFYLAWDACD
jgi:sugar-specific transcriptional regulator TrmB